MRPAAPVPRRGEGKATPGKNRNTQPPNAEAEAARPTLDVTHQRRRAAYWTAPKRAMLSLFKNFALSKYQLRKGSSSATMLKEIPGGTRITSKATHQT